MGFGTVRALPAIYNTKEFGEETLLESLKKGDNNLD